MLMLAVVPFSSVKHIACGEEEFYGKQQIYRFLQKELLLLRSHGLQKKICPASLVGFMKSQTTWF
jgi:hypothetical protein